MTAKPINTTSLPFKDHLSWKFLTLFVTVFLAVFVSGLVYDFYTTRMENQQNDSDSAEQPVLNPVEPKIERDLAQVLAPDSIPNTADIKDPFTDHGGIVGNTATRSSTTTAAVVTAPQSVKIAAAKGGTASKSAPPANSAPGISTPTKTNEKAGVQPAENINAKEAIETRVRERRQKMMMGQDAGPESAVLAIDDLLPVGMVSGGSGETEIMLYSQALAQTFSFPIGTHFYDGWMAEWRAEGVAFGHTNQNGAIFIKFWSHSITQQTQGNFSLVNAPERIARNGFED